MKARCKRKEAQRLGITVMRLIQRKSPKNLKQFGVRAFFAKLKLKIYLKLIFAK